MTVIPQSLLDDLELRDSGTGNIIGQIGISFNLYYSRNMWEISDVFLDAARKFFAYIPSGAINFYCNNAEWRPYKARSLDRLLNRFSSKDGRGYWLTFAQLRAASDEHGLYPVDEVGPYGLFLNGVNFRKGATADRDVSSIRFELPATELTERGKQVFLDFVEDVASIAPYCSGHAGYSFKYNSRTDENQEHLWISYKASRFLAFHPQLDNFERHTRDRLANVGWLTLLGTELSETLGGTVGMRNALSEAVTVKPLLHGTMLIAGDDPPLGDVNYRAPDLGPLREVARLTRPLWIDDSVVSNRILNYIWSDEEARLRWINRFERTF